MSPSRFEEDQLDPSMATEREALQLVINRRLLQTAKLAGATTLQGIPTMNAVGTQTSVEDANGNWLNVATKAKANNAATVMTAFTQTRRAWNPRLILPMRTGTIVTTVRYRAGLFSANPAASATPAIHMAGFRYDTGQGDTTWKFVTSDSVNRTIYDTGVPCLADTTYGFEVMCVPGGVEVWLDDVLLTTITTTLPGDTQQLGWGMTCTTLSAAIRSMKFTSSLLRY